MGRLSLVRISLNVVVSLASIMTILHDQLFESCFSLLKKLKVLSSSSTELPPVLWGMDFFFLFLNHKGGQFKAKMNSNVNALKNSLQNRMKRSNATQNAEDESFE